jgi:hypothetical protein
MSYEGIENLAVDTAFRTRIRGCCTEQAADTYRNSADTQDKALANSLISGGTHPYETFYSLCAAEPGFADTAGDPTDSSQITDVQILAAVQGEWHYVATLFF